MVKTPFPDGCQSVDKSNYTFFFEGLGSPKGLDFILTCHTQCSDDVDNDGDGLIDYGSDPGCDSPEDNDENQKPVITLTGDSVINLRVNRNYVEQEATVDDPEESDITGNLVIGGDIVDMSTVGKYVVTYNAQDTPGLFADEVIRTVNVTPPVYGAYCGDGVVNQWWELCDSGNNPQIVGCSNQCQYVIPDCREHVFIKTSLFNIQNVKQDADASIDVYIGGRIIPSGVWEVVMYDGVAVIDTDDMNTYEDTLDVGVTMQRKATGTITTRHFGSHQNDGTQEHLEGTIVFYGSDATSVGNDTSGNNQMENWGPNMVAQKAINVNKDAAWIDSEVSNFWTTVTIADDSFFTYWDPIPVCEDPNQPPVAVASSSQTILIGETVLLDGIESYDADGTIVSYDWDFGDTSNDTGSTTSHSYGTPGVYTVVLAVQDDDGATDTDSITITVQDSSPVYECSDRKDNDGDGEIDYPYDPGCDSPEDDDEYNPRCGDGNCDDGECCETCSDDCGECYTPPTTDPKTTGGGSSPLPYAKFQTPSVCTAIVTDGGVKITTESIANTETYDHSLHCNKDGHSSDFVERKNDSSAGYKYFSSIHNKYPFGARQFSLTLNIPGPIPDDGSYDCLVIMDEHHTERKEVRDKVVCEVLEQPVVLGIEHEEPDVTQVDFMSYGAPNHYLIPEDREWCWYENGQRVCHVNHPDALKEWKDFFNWKLDGKYGIFDNSVISYTIGSPLYNAILKWQEDEKISCAFNGYCRATGNAWVASLHRAREQSGGFDAPFNEYESGAINRVNTNNGRNDQKDKTTEDIPPVELPKN